jgi:hypothetical protein
MKNYQIITGTPKKDNAQFPTTSRRVIKHGKKPSSFELKMNRFRTFIHKATGEFSVNSSKISNNQRQELRRKALAHAGF